MTDVVDFTQMEYTMTVRMTTNVNKPIPAAKVLRMVEAAEIAPTETLPDTTVQGKTVEQAKAAFGKVIVKFTSSQMDVDATKAAHDKQVNEHGSAKVKLIVSLAEIALKHGWEHKYALDGIEKAIEAYEAAANNGGKAMRASSLRQFATECGRALHPKAREHVAADFARADKLWDAEGERVTKARDDAKEAGEKFVKPETPLRDAFKRKYHMVIGSNGILANRASKDPEKQELAEAAVDLAETVIGDERRDAKRAAKAIEKAVQTIEDIASEFPHPDWAKVVKFLSGVDKDELAKFARKAARQAKRPVDDLDRDETDTLIE
jgi:hypothetical protein